MKNENDIEDNVKEQDKSSFNEDFYLRNTTQGVCRRLKKLIEEIKKEVYNEIYKSSSTNKRKRRLNLSKKHE